MQMLIALYLLKYTTDVLGMAPVAMGSILLVSRVWDAISDPVVGFLSDRTRHRLGRRSPWMLAAAIPMGLTFTMMWSAPATLGPTQLTLWVGAAVVAFYTFRTVFGVPHDSLAAELSTDYHDRNRVFGIRRAFFGVGSILVFVALDGFLDSPETRTTTIRVTAAAGLLTAMAITFTAATVNERPENLGRGSASVRGAWRSVLANRHARLLLGVFFLQQIGTGGVTMMAAYYAEYVLLDSGAFVRIMGSLFGCSVLSIPLWIALGKRFDKKVLLLVAMTTVGVALSSMGFLGEGDHAPLWLVACAAGIAVGGLDVLFPSIQADVIDCDELATGERKEGVYFASWHFAAKTAMGVSGVVAGVALEATGFTPNVVQSDEVRLAIRATMSIIPLVTYAAGIALFTRFALTQSEHRKVRQALQERDAG
jgi:GPH family glycoside/pentoside/hexuronide:cation symporter